MFLLKVVLSFLSVNIIYLNSVKAGCPVSDNPSQMFQCLTINPQAFIDLISKGDFKSFCHMANGYMTCMTTYLRDCLGGKAATGILEELQDLNLKCCISGRTQECVVKNPALLQRCFAAENMIMFENGEEKPIIDVKVGDIVKAIDSNGDVINSEVVSLLHKNQNMSTLFQVFYDKHDNSISLTNSHMLYVDSIGYTKASNVKIGDKLRIFSKTERKLVDFIVKRIEFQVKTGFVAPLTNEGTILVNGIDSSCYAEANNHFLADLAMKPLKLWYKLEKLFNKNSKTESDIKNVDLYSMFLYNIGQKFFPNYLN